MLLVKKLGLGFSILIFRQTCIWVFTSRWSNHAVLFLLRFYIGVILPPYFCQPTEVPVKVPFPAVFPKYVKLWRCMGSSYAPLTHECVVKKMTQFWLKTLSHLIRMTNHTQCGDRCIFKKDNCNLTTHTFDPASCQCKCRTHVQFSCGFGKVFSLFLFPLAACNFLKWLISGIDSNSRCGYRSAC